MKGLREYYYIKFIFFIRYFADAMFYSYTALYLSSLGYKEGIIGTISSITTITCLVVNPIWSYFAKNNKISKILLIVLTLIEGSLIISYANASILELIMLFTAMLAIVAGPYYNLMDGHAIQVCKMYQKDYARVRVMGSLAYVVATPISGILIGSIGYKGVFFIAGSLFILVGLLSFFLRKIEEQKETEKRDFKKILKNKKFLIYTIAYICIVTISVVADNNISLFFTKQKGLTATEYSFVFTAILITEVVTIFMCSKFLRRKNLFTIFIVGGLIYFLRSVLISFYDLPLWILIGSACLRGIAWGFILFVHVKIIAKLVGLQNVTSAAILLSSLTNFAQFIFSNLFGYAIEYYGYSRVYLSVAGIVLVFSLGYGIYLKLNKNIEIEEA